jgi:hypothetical protein
MNGAKNLEARPRAATCMCMCVYVCVSTYYTHTEGERDLEVVHRAGDGIPTFFFNLF